MFFSGHFDRFSESLNICQLKVFPFRHHSRLNLSMVSTQKYSSGYKEICSWNAASTSSTLAFGLFSLKASVTLEYIVLLEGSVPLWFKKKITQTLTPNIHHYIFSQNFVTRSLKVGFLVCKNLYSKCIKYCKVSKWQ